MFLLCFFPPDKNIQYINQGLSSIKKCTIKVHCRSDLPSLLFLQNRNTTFQVCLMASEDLEYEPMNHTDHFNGAFSFIWSLTIITYFHLVKSCLDILQNILQNVPQKRKKSQEQHEFQ